MKIFLILILAGVASIAHGQVTNTVIYCNGSIGMSSGAVWVGGTFNSDTINGSAVKKLSIHVATAVYPNPSTGSFTIDAPNLGARIKATVYNARGISMLDATPFMTRTNNKLKFELRSLVAADYFLILEDGKLPRAYKLTIY